jgi:hypothetical protein
MQRLIKRFLKQPEYVKHYRGVGYQPMDKWKRNTLAGLLGVALGLYVGQYFPDIYFRDVVEYLPEL